jgi:hypothetical protein
MTEEIKTKLQNMNEDQLKKVISVNFHNKEVVEYCESLLSKPTREDAMADNGDISDMVGNI